MDFGSFYSSVYQFWGSVGPSLIYVILALNCLYFCFPDSYRSLKVWYQANGTKLKGHNPINDFLKGIGASAVYPILVAVLALLAFDVIYAVITMAESLPPNLVCDDHRIAYSEFGYSDMARLAFLFPDAGNFASAYQQASELLGGDHPARGGLALYTTVLMLVAKAIIITVLMMIAFCLRKERDRKKSICRTMGVIAIAVMTWAICVVPWLAEYEIGARATAKQMIIKLRDRTQKEDWLASAKGATDAPPDVLLSPDRNRWWRLDCTVRYRLWTFWFICFPKAEPPLPAPPVQVVPPNPN